jgi:hypothetical protein
MAPLRLVSIARATGREPNLFWSWPTQLWRASEVAGMVPHCLWPDWSWIAKAWEWCPQSKPIQRQPGRCIWCW